MTAKVKCHIWKAANGEWTFHIIRGARITLVPGETYQLRGGARRAVRALAEISTDRSLQSYVSQLQAACLKELGDEQKRWDLR